MLSVPETFFLVLLATSVPMPVLLPYGSIPLRGADIRAGALTVLHPGIKKKKSKSTENTPQNAESFYTKHSKLLLLRLVRDGTLILVSIVPHPRQRVLHVLIDQEGHAGRWQHPDDVWSQSTQY